jgi:glycosyltransferase involved in cell wall biosynthesis
MKLSIIIPCLNEAEFIATQLESLSTQYWSEPWEVIVSDNGSADQTLQIVNHYRLKLPHLRLVDASDRRGRAHAKNVGARAALGESLAFCDADDEVSPGWVAALGEALSKHDFVASRFEIEKLNPPYLRPALGNPQRHGLNKYKHPPYLYYAGGCGLGIKRSIHEAVGGFDESWPVLEETDYCFRVQLAGTPLQFVPNAVVHIRFHPRLSHLYDQSRSWGEYQVLLYKTYCPPGTPNLLWREGLKAWRELFRSLPQIRSSQSRAAWVRRLGWRVGRIQGGFRFRVLAL